MYPDLPTIIQLRAFEASVRHLSFTKAAEEIFLTPSAVSHQIHSLEDLVQQRLFVRRSRKLVLTPAGEELSAIANKVLPTLHLAVQKMRLGSDTKSLTICTLPSIAATWLVVRLGRLRSAFPGIELTVIASDRPENFASDNAIDFAITFVDPTAPEIRNLWQRKLMDEFYLPVCTGALLDDPNHPIRKPEDLRHHTLIDQDKTLGWKGWFDYNRITDVTPSGFLSLNHGDLAIQAAIEGQGVALVRLVMAQRALEQGTLVPAFSSPLPARRQYYILAPDEAGMSAIALKVIDWLCAEASEGEGRLKGSALMTGQASE